VALEDRHEGRRHGAQQTAVPDAEGQLVVVEEPTAANNYTTVLMLYDPREGARKWDLTIKFDAQ